ncbi:MAG: TadE-like protein [Candidatus Aerophobetes bacterium ADurb.Bin490]|nr:MAG: TadE-like protein [Candidatus Aerophobetes bacterium ADurb.Bin490]HPI04377.1 pilus assembly protein [Candidatus Goldiibacteriota bacterium]HPN65753.1 pilus assembly protein [Candidatus Goldiibacteriota bacterium]HRQ42939.1 pilus assembly protein [Candidatus Goldiibacteriota bacterium]
MTAINRYKGQAMAEFIIVLPLLILMLFGIIQFASISLDRVKLAMVERELMRFITSESEKPEMLESFAKEYAAAEGLNPDLLAVSTGEGEKPEQKGILGDLMENFTGVTINLEYICKTSPVFEKITGKEGIKLKTSIYSAKGGPLKFVLTEKQAEKVREYGMEVSDEAPVH